MHNRFVVIILVFVAALFLSGCGSHRRAAMDDPNGEWVPIHQTAAMGQTNINKIQLGMARDEVVEIMGTKTHYGKRPHRAPTIIPHPYKREIVTHKNKKYEVIYYYTKYAKRDAALTPVVIHKGKVSGWGWGFLRSLRTD